MKRTKVNKKKIRKINTIRGKWYQDKVTYYTVKDLNLQVLEAIQSYQKRRGYYPTLEDITSELPNQGVFYIRKNDIHKVVQTHHGIHDCYLTELKGSDDLYLKVYVLEVNNEEAYVIYQDVDLFVDTVNDLCFLEGNIYKY